MQYMVAEAQYGGRITDDLDRELFNTYTAKWFCRWAKSSRAQGLGRVARDQKNWSGDSSLPSRNRKRPDGTAPWSACLHIFRWKH